MIGRDADYVSWSETPWPWVVTIRSRVTAVDGTFSAPFSEPLTVENDAPKRKSPYKPFQPRSHG